MQPIRPITIVFFLPIFLPSVPAGIPNAASETAKTAIISVE